MVAANCFLVFGIKSSREQSRVSQDLVKIRTKTRTVNPSECAGGFWRREGSTVRDWLASSEFGYSVAAGWRRPVGRGAGSGFGASPLVAGTTVGTASPRFSMILRDNSSTSAGLSRGNWL